MTEVLTYIIFSTIGALIALLIKESYDWKQLGRTEAINRYENLLVNCYGILNTLIKKMKFRPTQVLIDNELFNEIEKVFLQFSFRLPENILNRMEALIYSSKEHDRTTKELNLEEETPIEFLEGLNSDIEIMTSKLKAEIKELESYTQSIPARLRYIFKVWGFENKELLS